MGVGLGMNASNGDFRRSLETAADTLRDSGLPEDQIMDAGFSAMDAAGAVGNGILVANGVNA